MLEKEYDYFKRHREELLLKYPGRWVLVLGESIIGDYATQEDAIREALKKNPPGTFLVQQCSSDANQIMRFHSRVTFPEHAEV